MDQGSACDNQLGNKQIISTVVKDDLYLANSQRVESSPLHFPVAGVLDEPYIQLTPLSGVAVEARQSTQAGTVSILCSLAGRYGYSTELAYFELAFKK